MAETGLHPTKASLPSNKVFLEIASLSSCVTTFATVYTCKSDLVGQQISHHFPPFLSYYFCTLRTTSHSPSSLVPSPPPKKYCAIFRTPPFLDSAFLVSTSLDATINPQLRPRSLCAFKQYATVFPQSSKRSPIAAILQPSRFPPLTVASQVQPTMALPKRIIKETERLMAEPYATR